ncbi:MAG TPA: GspMb/PilO family protein [Longimicrobiales bacterium]
MRLRELTAAERRTIAIGGTIIVSLVAVFRGVPAWMAWRVEARDNAVVLRAEVARATAMHAAFPMMLDSLEARIARLREMRPAPLAAANAQEAGAVLMRLVEEAARAGSIQVTALDVDVDTAGTGSLPRVAVVLDGAGDITGLATMLRELEAGPIAVAVQGLSIAPQNIETPENEIETLMLRLRVEALALGAEVTDDAES